MKGFTRSVASLCILAIVVCGCVTRSFRQTAISDQGALEPLKLSSLSEHMRAVYKLSSQSTDKQDDERAQLLAQFPRLAELAARIEQNAADTGARSELAAAYIDHQLYWPAYELLTATEAVKPDDRETNVNLARIWDVWGEYDLALKYIQRAIVEGDSSSRGYELIGRIQLHRNEPAQAINWYTRAAQQDNSATVLANLGYAYILLSDWEQAKSSLERAIELDSSLPEPHNNLAMVLMKLGDAKAALSELLKTAQAHVAFNNMGVLYLQQENVLQAQQFFEEALRLEPGYDVAQRNLTTVRALIPTPTEMLNPSTSNVPQNANCPPIEKASPVNAKAEVEPAISADIDLMGSHGVVETDLVPLDQQNAATPIPAAAGYIKLHKAEAESSTLGEQKTHRKLTRTDIYHASDQTASQPARPKAPEPEPTPTEKHTPAAVESNGVCTLSSASDARHNTWSSMFNLYDQRLSMAGIMGLLLGTAALAVRSKKPRVLARVTPK